MKFTKYTYRTPLFGSIDAGNLLPDTDERIELSPEQMYGMYHKGSELLCFLSENADDLAFCAPEELEGVVFRAEFGECTLRNGRMYLLTHIWVDGDLTESGEWTIMDWITGQMADGWGEGLEQRAWKREGVRRPTLYFDEDSLEFEEDEDHWYAEYYVHPWNSDDFEIILDDVEEVEEEASYEVVATMSIPYHNRQIVKLKRGLSLKMFLRDYVRDKQFALEIEDSLITNEGIVFMVMDLEGNSGVEVLPKWVAVNGHFCIFNDSTLTIEGPTKTQMPVLEAMLELFK